MKVRHIKRRTQLQQRLAMHKRALNTKALAEFARLSAEVARTLSETLGAYTNGINLVIRELHAQAMRHALKRLITPTITEA